MEKGVNAPTHAGSNIANAMIALIMKKSPQSKAVFRKPGRARNGLQLRLMSVERVLVLAPSGTAG